MSCEPVVTNTPIWRVSSSRFCNDRFGSGIVHQRPAFGEVDHDVLVDEQRRFVEGQRPELLCAVGPDGKFTNDVLTRFKSIRLLELG